MSDKFEVFMLVGGFVLELILIQTMIFLSEKKLGLKIFLTLLLPIYAATPVILIKLNVIESTLFSMIFSGLYFFFMIYGVSKKDKK